MNNGEKRMPENIPDRYFRHIPEIQTFKNENMKKMVNFLTCFCWLFFIATTGNAASKEEKATRYDLECAGTGSDGSYLIKVWSYVKNPKKATLNVVKRNAVHGVIFRGFSGNQGCTSQRPMVKSPAIEEEQADFFQHFFADGGAYTKFAAITGVPEVIKVGKEYKVGYVVSVTKDALRKALEEAGIVKGLSSNF